MPTSRSSPPRRREERRAHSRSPRGAGREAAPGSALPVWLPGPRLLRRSAALLLVPEAMQSTGSRSTASVLAELQWDDGYAVPMADAENRALEDDVSAGCGRGAVGRSRCSHTAEGRGRLRQVGPRSSGALGTRLCAGRCWVPAASVTLIRSST